MSRVFFSTELETISTFWRILRKDGVALGFTSHNQNLSFDDILHRSAPGMLPSAIRRAASIELDSAEVQGALTHDAISEADLTDGRFDGARITIGIVDWENLERTELYHGEIGEISSESGGFEAELRSAKADLELDTIPRTSPTCRARFCGPGCGLSTNRFTHAARVTQVDLANNRVQFSGAPSANAMIAGSLRWVDGPQAGIEAQVLQSDGNGLTIDLPLDPQLQLGAQALLREGCDHTLSTCATRFANSVNFQGEPFLPGNDALVRYPISSS